MVKSIYFHLQAYRKLPEDFTERERSVWVTASNATYCDPEEYGRGLNDSLSEYEYAAELGYDGLGINEHHENGYGGSPGPAMTAYLLARRTTKAAIVLMGQTLPTHQPLRAAEEMALVDCVSGGRLVAGMPTGTPMDTAVIAGLPPAQIRDRYREAHDLILEAWSRPGPFAFNGKYTKLRYVNPWPQPIQAPPPIWIAGGSSKETYEFAAEHNYMYSNLSLRGIDAAHKQLQQYWDTVERFGLDDNPYRAGMVLSVAIAETDAEAERLYAPHFPRFFQIAGHVTPGLSTPPGYMTKDTLRGVVKQIGTVSYYKPPIAPTWKSLVDSGTLIAGSPETVAERIVEIVKKLRVGHLVVSPQTATMPVELSRYNARLYAEKVMPRLRGLWDDTGYENHWWPKACGGTGAAAGAARAEKVIAE